MFDEAKEFITFIVSIVVSITGSILGTGYFVRRSLRRKEYSEANLTQAKAARVTTETELLKTGNIEQIVSGYQALNQSYIGITNELQTELKSVKEEVIRLWANNSELRKKQVEYQTRLLDYSVDIEKLREQLTKINKDKDDLRLQLALLMQENQELRDQLTQVKSENRELQNRLKELEAHDHDRRHPQ